MKLLFFFFSSAFLLVSCDFNQGVQRNYIISQMPEQEEIDMPSLHEESP